MSDGDLGPRLSDADKLHFLDAHRPELTDGDYEITLRQTVPDHGFSAARTLSLTVAGPRVALEPAALADRFPPPGSTGHVARVLPHVALTPATLPWERSALAGAGRDGPPWMALLIFTDAEIAGRSSTTTLKAIREGKVTGADGLAPMAGDDPEARVTLLELTGAEARDALPRGPELDWSASLRETTPARGPSEARAVVMATRLPPPGARCTAHLVSLEGQYGADAQGVPTHPAHGPNPPPTVRLVSLARWSFTAEEARGDLQAKLAAIAPRRLARDATGLGPAAGPVLGGAVPVEVARRDGTRGAAWYRGPLMPPERAATQPPVPFRRADDLVTRDPGSGLPNITHACAWELGRLVAQETAEVALSLLAIKRAFRREAHLAAQTDAHPELAPHAPKVEQDAIEHWLEGAVFALEAVPFAYLVPDPALLPPESLAFGRIDPGWLLALFDGAFSTGRTNARAMDADRAFYRRKFPDMPDLSALLLRSEVVRGWPDLVVDGLREGAVQRPTRFARLGPETVMLLFRGGIDEAQLHLHPQAIHFGLDAAGAGFAKHGHPVAWRNGTPGHVDLSALAARLAPDGGAGAFALRMIEPVPRRSYRLEPAP